MKNINKYTIKDNYSLLTIIDTKGRTTEVIVDTDKVEHLKHYSFRLNGNGYIKTKQNIYLHQLIYGDTNNMEIDHINRNKLDNRLCNLRLCTHKDNCKNRMKTELQGITKLKRLKSKPYQVRVNNKHYGYYSTLEEAIVIRNKLYKDIYKDYSAI